MKKIGNGFHDGPPSVTRSRWTISRPQRIHAHGSYVGVDGKSSVSAEMARQPAMMSAIWTPWRSSARLTVMLSPRRAPVEMADIDRLTRGGLEARRRPQPRPAAVAGDQHHQPDDRDRHVEDEAQQDHVGDRGRARGAERLRAERHGGVERPDRPGRRRQRGDEVGERHEVQRTAHREVQIDRARDGQVHGGLHRPQQERPGQQHQTAPVQERPRCVRQRAQPVAHALEDVVSAQDPDRHRRRASRAPRRCRRRSADGPWAAPPTCSARRRP